MEHFEQRLTSVEQNMVQRNSLFKQFMTALTTGLNIIIYVLTRVDVRPVFFPQTKRKGKKRGVNGKGGDLGHV